ncbi:MAG: polysaccharide biosynthesis tyrosine autokinase, partial [Bacteroidota bacterium]|nr:polysaccharide biosynthesis tyrosine autokinase [Bacteroidota bacterium]
AQMERKILIDGNVPLQNVLVKQKEEEIEKIRQSLMENLRNIKSTLNTFINDLQRKSNSAQGSIKSLPAKLRNLEEIQRQQTIKLSIYKILLEKREETAISGASTISNSKIVEKAFPDIKPVKPKRRNIQLIAFFIGLLLPAFFIFILELLNDKVWTRYDIEKLTNAPILGEIGHSFANIPLVVTKTNRTMVAEQFRILRSNLQYVLNKIEKPVMLVTSSFSGEGKSFVATNMGAVLALAGKKTIVLEFDIRKPKVLAGLKIPKRTGITNFLVGKATPEELPSLVPGYDNLFVMGCGPVPPNPSELLLDTRVADLFAYLRQNFDVILIDTAPVGMVSDAQTLGKFADCSLYLVRQGHTYKKQIALIDELYLGSKLPKISVILNGVRIKPGFGYYGYGRYGYGAGHKSAYYQYYEEEVEPRPKFFEWFNLKRMKTKFGKKE